MKEPICNVWLLNAGSGNPFPLIRILQKINNTDNKGAAKIINNVPCKIAVNVPRSIADQMLVYLQKAGAIARKEKIIT